MGERDRVVAPPPPQPWPQRGLLAACFLALLVAVLWLGPAEPGPDLGARALVTGLLHGASMALAGPRGPAVLGVIMLALAAAMACPPLERRVGPGAPLLVALLVFGSGCWALVWTGGADLVPLALAVAAFALAYGGGGGGEAPAEIYRPPETGPQGAARWLAVGLLLAQLVPGSPLAAALLVPAGLAAPRDRRAWLLPFLAAGFAAGLGLEVLTRGPEALTEPLAAAARTFSLDPALVGRALLALLAGRNVGLLIGFAPILLLPVGGRGAEDRPGLAVVCFVAPLLGALLWPLDFAGGWLAVSFLPFYGALWLLPFGMPRAWQGLLVAVLAGLATWPLWVAPRQAMAGGGAGLTASWPRRELPYEVALRHLPNRGEAWLAGDRVRVRAVDGCRLLGEPGRFEMLAPGPTTLWIAAPEELGMAALELGPGAPSSFEVAGASAGRTVFRPDGRVGFEVLLDEPRARHRLWFDERPLAIHLVELRLPVDEGARPVRFRLMAGPQP